MVIRKEGIRIDPMKVVEDSAATDDHEVGLADCLKDSVCVIPANGLDAEGFSRLFRARLWQP